MGGQNGPARSPDLPESGNVSEPSAGPGGVRVEAGQGVIWDRFAPVLRGLVENSNGFRTAMEAFRSKISGRYFVKCANVRYPLSK